MEWIQKNRTLLIVEGILFTLLGLLAIAMPVISTLSAELFIGWILLFGGIVQLYRSIKTRKNSGFFWSLIISLLYILFGVLLIIFPIAGMFSLTILLIGFFIVEGIAKIILGFQLKPFRYWGWMLFSGVIALIMAAIIWSGWPGTAFWVIGLLVGINMIFFGISLLTLGFDKPKTPDEPAPPLV